jgi:hypothetical protein
MEIVREEVVDQAFVEADEFIEEVQVVEEEVEVPVTSDAKEQPKQDYRTFDFGNLNLGCGRCGHDEILELGVESGIQVVIPTTDKHELRLVCPKCKNFMRLYFTENFTKKKETKDEPETESKETESVQGVTESN